MLTISVNYNMDMNKCVSKIQKIFLFKRFVNAIEANKALIGKMTKLTEEKKYASLFNDQQQKLDDFERLKKIITDKKNIQAFEDILKKIYRFYKIDNQINARKMMSAWVIVGFPDIVMGREKKSMTDTTAYPDDIYFICKRMITIISSFSINCTCESIRQFLKLFNQFNNAINYFLNRDRTEQFHKLSSEYFDTYKTIESIKNSKKYTEDEKVKCINVVSESLNKILKLLKTYDNTISKEVLDSYANFEIVINKKIYESEKSILLGDIEGKKFILFQKVINEIKDNIKHMRGKNKKIFSDLDDVLDTELLIRNMSYYVLEKDNIEVYGNYLIEIINKLQAPIKVKETIQKWHSMKNSCATTNEYLVCMLFLVMEELCDIKETITNLATLTSHGIQIF